MKTLSRFLKVIFARIQAELVGESLDTYTLPGLPRNGQAIAVIELLLPSDENNDQMSEENGITHLENTSDT